MDVVLIQPPRYKRKASKRSQPPLSLAYIASYLISKGFEVKVIDGEIENLSVSEIEEMVCSLSPLAVGITTMTEDRFNAIDICNRIKSRSSEVLVFAGGSHFSYSAEDALTSISSLDVVVIGEG